VHTSILLLQWCAATADALALQLDEGVGRSAKPPFAAGAHLPPLVMSHNLRRILMLRQTQRRSFAKFCRSARLSCSGTLCRCILDLSRCARQELRPNPLSARACGIIRCRSDDTCSDEDDGEGSETKQSAETPAITSKVRALLPSSMGSAQRPASNF
jgi:hypothetical protein